MVDIRRSPLRIWLRYMGAVCLPPRSVNGGLRVLTYHRIRPDANDLRSISPQLFRRHLEILKANWNVISLDEVLAAARGEKPLPERSVLITFDDGYADLYRYAFPLLQEFGFKAVIFMLARYVGRVGRTYSEANYPEAPFLSIAQLREMSQEDIEIGSHGLWHVPLVHLPPKEAEEEVKESKRILSDLLGFEIRAFSYPWGRAGDFRKEHVAMVEDAGYEIAFTMLHGFNHLPFERFKMRRCHVYPWDVERTFNAVLEGRFDGWCLKNSVLWNRRKELKKLLRRFLTKGGSGKKF